MFVIASEMGYAKVLCDTREDAERAIVPEWSEQVVEVPDSVEVDQLNAGYYDPAIFEWVTLDTNKKDA